MNFKKILGVVILIIGIGSICFSLYIKGRINEGKTQVSRAQKELDQGNSLFSLNPVSKEIGKEISGSVQKKINEGSEKIKEYEALAHWLLIGGIALIILGGGSLFIGRKTSR
ncbi:MAG: hypothetical protein KGZ39_04050 [Simkania sp.]|nr:hypothetical protein [Simkania sp.]